MAESGHDYLEILPDEEELPMNRTSVEIPLLGTSSGKCLAVMFTVQGQIK
jgi:hypothetical protein